MTQVYKHRIYSRIFVFVGMASAAFSKEGDENESIQINRDWSLKQAVNESSNTVANVSSNTMDT